MTRVVWSADGRSWTVRGMVNWYEPASKRDFEHDVAAGPASGVAMLAVTVALLLAVVLTIPPGVVVPPWLILLVLLGLAVLPLQWAASRSWTIVAETSPLPEQGLPAERWVGMVQGTKAARREIRRVTQSLQRDVPSPDDGRGCLSRRQ